VRSGGTLYGTTNGGGTGYGTVFKLTSTGKEIVLHTFTGGVDGGSPEGNLIRDIDGNLYGTTFTGGTSTGGLWCVLGCGTVYKLSAAGIKTVLYNFQGGTDAAFPTSGLVRDANGNLYGATPYGGNSDGGGAVFEITPAGDERLLYVFPGGTNGAFTVGGVIRDGKSNLYGATFGGGSSSCSSGCGVVFRLTP
jgi:uncharacterized repeat protein (TIGR03803 family)